MVFKQNTGSGSIKNKQLVPNVIYVVFSNIFYFHPYPWGDDPILLFFEMACKHQLDDDEYR